MRYLLTVSSLADKRPELSAAVLKRYCLTDSRHGAARKSITTSLKDDTHDQLPHRVLTRDHKIKAKYLDAVEADMTSTRCKHAARSSLDLSDNLYQCGHVRIVRLRLQANSI
jgi:hypothetical protein